jgi:hypothetical protein
MAAVVTVISSRGQSVVIKLEAALKSPSGLSLRRWGGALVRPSLANNRLPEQEAFRECTEEHQAASQRPT